MTNITLDKVKNMMYNSDITKRRKEKTKTMNMNKMYNNDSKVSCNNLKSYSKKFEENFERILNDYSLDTADKEKAIKRYIKTFGFEFCGEK